MTIRRLLLTLGLGLALATSLASPIAPVQAGDRALLSAQEHVELGQITAEILRTHPSSEYFYLGIGQSPTAVMAALSLAHPDSVRNIPLSGFRKLPDSFFGALNSDQRAELKRHFEKFLPSARELNGRKLLLIDYSQSGESLISAELHITQYYAARAEAVPVRALALTSKSPEFWPRMRGRAEALDLELDLQTLQGEPGIASKLDDQYFDDLSEFGSWRVETKPFVARERPQYQALKQEIRSQSPIPSGACLGGVVHALPIK